MTQTHTEARPTTARHTRVTSPLGDVVLVAREAALVGAYFDGQRYLPEAWTFGPRVDPGADPVLGLAAEQLAEYFAGERRAFDLPLAPRGDAFAQRVWALLCAIPYGATTTYGALAEQVGGRGLAQAVGQSVGHNPISVIVPCHRVLGSDGSLTGYAGGLDRKRALLALEEPAEVTATRLF